MTPPTDLPFSLERTITIAADRATVFRFFTDPDRWAAWWGAGSHIDARPGGAVVIRYPNGLVARGEVLELVAPERIAFTFGYDRPDPPIAPGGSRVTITLTEAPDGTRVALRHDVETAAQRDAHGAGWRYHMGVFASVVGREHDAGATATIDRYLAAWSERDPATRRAALAATCVDAVVYRDPYGFAVDRDDLDGHIAAAQLHLPATLGRDGAARVGLGMAVVGWHARGGDGGVAARGTSVIELAPDGRIARITGFWHDRATDADAEADPDRRR